MTERASLAGRPAASAAPFSFVAVCSGPIGDDFDVANLVSTDANRWSARGEPTLYLAGDLGVALAEVGRHWREGFSGVGLWQVRLALDAAVDLRRPQVRSAAGLPDDPCWILERDRCRELATRLRVQGCDGMLVPSVAFLDDLQRWNAVVFVDRVPSLVGAVGHARRIQEIAAAG